MQHAQVDPGLFDFMNEAASYADSWQQGAPQERNDLMRTVLHRLLAGDRKLHIRLATDHTGDDLLVPGMSAKVDALQHLKDLSTGVRIAAKRSQGGKKKDDLDSEAEFADGGRPPVLKTGQRTVERRKSKRKRASRVSASKEDESEEDVAWKEASAPRSLQCPTTQNASPHVAAPAPQPTDRLANHDLKPVLVSDDDDLVIVSSSSRSVAKIKREVNASHAPTTTESGGKRIRSQADEGSDVAGTSAHADLPFGNMRKSTRKAPGRVSSEQVDDLEETVPIIKAETPTNGAMENAPRPRHRVTAPADQTPVTREIVSLDSDDDIVSLSTSTMTENIKGGGTARLTNASIQPSRKRIKVEGGNDISMAHHAPPSRLDSAVPDERSAKEKAKKRARLELDLKIFRTEGQLQDLDDD
ncbi:hypothetical protein LTR97_011812 [Elasticomyces elasticus]|uniref:Uncharacterized protein n=1 Tax=Elasticomyces elasticus TaxID=574655 RepID=A0AAN7ZVI4_9PEZI|nr:hypothetical protein LTR97_011812 [Elasticomyces elasticus]